MIPNGVRVPDEVGPPAEPPEVLYVGRLSPEKNIDTLVEAVGDLNLVVAGDGPLRERVPNGLGAVPHAEVERLLERASVVVAPCEREGFGVAAAEAMAFGRPVVAAAGGASAGSRRRRRDGSARAAARRPGAARGSAAAARRPGAAASGSVGPPVHARASASAGTRDRADARGLQRRARRLRSRGSVPGDRSLEPLAERRLRLEPEQLAGARRVEAASWLPVRLRRVPADLALEAGQLATSSARSRIAISSPVPRLTGSAPS